MSLPRGISYGNAHKGVEVKINRMATVDPEMISQYNAVAGPLLAMISTAAKRASCSSSRTGSGAANRRACSLAAVLDAHALCRDDGKVFYKNALPNDAPRWRWGSCWMSPVP